MTKVHLAIRFARLPDRKPYPWTASTIRRHVHAVSAQYEANIVHRPNLKAAARDTSSPTPKPPLSLLPLSSLLRSYAITALSSYPVLLTPSLRLLSILAHSSSPLLNPDRNPLLHFILKRTFYAQFCAGETPSEVQRTSQGLKSMGFAGVILAYGKEIVLSRGETLEAPKTSFSDANQTQIESDIEAEATAKDIRLWKQGTLETVSMTSPGDFVALKFSGAGRDAMRQLAANHDPSAAMADAITEICTRSQAKGVRLLFDAEQDAVQRGIDAWTMTFQQRYNNTGTAVVYGTYQSYLRSTPEILSHHLATAESHGFALGVKLVRGAYMASDPRDLFWASKAETDNVYDGIASALITRQWNDILRPHPPAGPEAPAPAFPDVNFVLASHNQDSVRKAMALRAEQTCAGTKKIDMSYGQLMGMADEVSCDLVARRIQNGNLGAGTPGNGGGAEAADGPKAYKYLVWGSVRECLKYLVRRAEENRDAVYRARSSRRALRAELARRILG